jgi:hypothetical protein
MTEDEVSSANQTDMETIKKILDEHREETRVLDGKLFVLSVMSPWDSFGTNWRSVWLEVTAWTVKDTYAWMGY